MFLKHLLRMRLCARCWKYKTDIVPTFTGTSREPDSKLTTTDTRMCKSWWVPWGKATGCSEKIRREFDVNHFLRETFPGPHSWLSNSVCGPEKVALRRWYLYPTMVQGQDGQKEDHVQEHRTGKIIVHSQNWGSLVWLGGREENVSKWDKKDRLSVGARSEGH